MKRRTGLAVLGALLIAGNAAAHYTFIMPQKFRLAPGEALAVGYHSADGFPESSRAPKSIEGAFVIAGGRRTPITNMTPDENRLVATVPAPSGHIILTGMRPAVTESMSSGSFTNYLEEEGLQHVLDARAKNGETDKPGRERYSMFLKSILLAGAPDEGYKAIVGSPIEIVPEKDPYQIEAGEALPVRVLLRDKPASGLEIYAATPGQTNKSVGKTDAEGRLSVPVTRGAWRLHTISIERVALPDADWESFWATLTFEIP